MILASMFPGPMLSDVFVSPGTFIPKCFELALFRSFIDLYFVSYLFHCFFIY